MPASRKPSGLEPDHQPRYKFFAPFEYAFYRQLTDDCGLIDAFRALHPKKIQHSWVGRTGDGYRYDHVHCTAGLATKLVSCDYLHEVRIDRLSDHSALSVRLTIEPSQPLITSAPTTIGALPTLF
jgi:exodeoxyribonuclease III